MLREAWLRLWLWLRRGGGPDLKALKEAGVAEAWWWPSGRLRRVRLQLPAATPAEGSTGGRPGAEDDPLWWHSRRRPGALGGVTGRGLADGRGGEGGLVEARRG